MQRNQYTIAQHSESVNTFNFHQHKVSHILNKTHRKVSSSEQHKGTALLLIMHCRKFATRPAIARVKRTNLCVIQIHKKYMNTYSKFSSQSVTLFAINSYKKNKCFRAASTKPKHKLEHLANDDKI